MVDDGSTDGTAAVAARRRRRRASRPAAARRGGSASRGPASRARRPRAATALLFLDADTWLAPDGVARLAAAPRGAGADGLLSVQPFHRVERPYEQLSAVRNVVPILASGHGGAAAGRARSVAFGPCLLTRADALARGGRLRGGARRDRRGRRPRPRLPRARAARSPASAAATTVAFRMYPDGLGRSSRGGRKNLAGGARRARAAAAARRGALGGGRALSVALDAVSRPDRGAVVAGLGGHRGRSCGGCCAGSGRSTGWTAALFPVPLVAFVGAVRAVAGAAAGCAGRSTWRGRRIDRRVVMLPLLVDAVGLGHARSPTSSALGGVHAGSGLRSCTACPLARLQHDGWLLRPAAVEHGGRCLRAPLRIRRWKDHLPEAGALFAGGVSKRHRRAARPRPLRRRDPPGRARPLAGAGVRPAVRALEPAARRGR